ncbi:FxLYD domain-containing protein [Rhodocaloribacter litoris]|uniref:FxLYD domain-containing protein n=1 Tax=Rhodocaloribacter litoris TaxID=2558931 RepID=UPI001420C7F7|nr:FxLYD domain-containing protein [Rhodocaloribacter litoris]QXD14118.1 FxLYD domain-containing protein [Rhodocaloribacter litoris]
MQPIRRAFLGTWLLLAALLPAACGGRGDAGAEPTVHVEDFEYLLLPGEVRVLTGRVVNPTDEPIAHAQLQVSLFDADNRRIGSMIIVVDDIPARGEKAFREVIDSDEDIRGARVRSILVL